MHYFGPPPTFIPVKIFSSYAPVEYASAIANHSAFWPHPLSDYLCPFTKSTSYSNCDKVKCHLVFVQPGTISVSVLYRCLGDHTFYNMYVVIYTFITYYMRFLYILPYPFCESAHISHHIFHTTLCMCIESHTFHYRSLWLRYWMEEFVKHSVEKVKM